MSFRAVRAVTVGIFLCALAGSVAHSAAVPLFHSADEVGHFDYAYQVWHGHLPDFYTGIVINQLKGSTMPVQWVSQHPPLFYLLLAPIIGPLTDSGHVLIAGTLTRVVNILIGSAVPLATIWSVRRAFPGRTTVSLLAGMVVATSPWLHGVSGAIYNDALAALLATLLLGIAGGALRRETTRGAWVRFIALASAAMLCRLALMVIVAACTGAMVLATLRSEKGTPARAFGGLVATGATILLTSGWFYWHNLQVSGTATGVHSDWAIENLGRQTLTVWEVVASPSAWMQLLGLFWNTAFPKWQGFLLLIVPCSLGALTLVRRALHHQIAARTGSVIALWSLTALGVIAMQIKYAMGGGALNPRYILPLILPVAALMACGLLSLPRFGPGLTCIWVVATALLTIEWSGLSSTAPADDFANSPSVSVGATVIYVAVLGATTLAVVASLARASFRAGAASGDTMRRI